MHSRNNKQQLLYVMFLGYIAGPKMTKSLFGSGSDLQCIPTSSHLRGLSPVESGTNSTFTILAPAVYDRKNGRETANKKIDCAVCSIQRKAQVKYTLLYY